MTAPALDRDAVLGRLHGDTVLARAMAALMLEEMPRQFDAARRAVANNDAEALAQAAHLLKGSVGNFAAAESESAAVRLEQVARSGDLSDAPAALQVLEAALERLTPALRELTA